MAIYQIGPPTGEMRGSIGGWVFSRNSSGPYIRNRGIPVDPNTPLQQYRRAAFQEVAAAWTATLGSQNRQAWNDWASQVSWLNPLGQTIKLSGFNHFLRLNCARVLAQSAIQGDPPTEYVLPQPITGLTVSADNDLGTSIGFTAGQAWAGETGAKALIFMSDSMSVAKTFLGSRYRYAGYIAGNVTTPPASPQTTYMAPWSQYNSGQQMQIYVRILRLALGLSEPVYAVGQITAV